MRNIKIPVSLSAEQNEKLLSLLPPGTDPERIVFWDIETTGLSRLYDSVYLMGYLYWEGRQMYIEQHLASALSDEPEILRDFIGKSEYFEKIVTFNGDTFDMPFVKERLRRLHIPGEISAMQSVDLYREFRPYAALLGLPDCKLKTVERFLQIERQDVMSGGELISVYDEYTRTDSPDLEKILLLHNYEDILHLPELLPVQSLIRYLYHSEICSCSITQQSDSVMLTFRTAESAPLCVCTSFPHKKLQFPVTLETDGSQIQLTVPLHSGVLRYYIPNYKDYILLPDGTPQLKSFSVPVSEKATRSNCFLQREGTFLVFSGQTELPAGIHLFRQDLHDRKQYLLLEELPKFLTAAGPEGLRSFLTFYLL